MSLTPFISLGVALTFATLAWLRRARFAKQPYHHWFIFFHMTALGLHQFEEYGFPGGFRDFFVTVFTGMESSSTVVADVATLEAVNAIGLTALFALAGWVGTRVTWFGLGVLFISFGNGFFHIIYTVTRMSYAPGAITSVLFFLPLGMLATHFAVTRGDVDRGRLLLAFGWGTLFSFLPFIHTWVVSALR